MKIFKKIHSGRWCLKIITPSPQASKKYLSTFDPVELVKYLKKRTLSQFHQKSYLRKLK